MSEKKQAKRRLRKPLNVPDDETTKSRILMESARMFAVSGYAAVSVRDIAKATGITPATIYTHFSAKEDILESIIQLFEKELKVYYEMMDRLSYEAENFAQLLKNLFVESEELVNPFANNALYCACTNQYAFECCRRLYFDVYFLEGHEVMKRQLDIAVERGLVKPFDTRMIATVITNSFLSMVSTTVGRTNGFHQDFDLFAWYDRTIRHILQVTGYEQDTP